MSEENCPTKKYWSNQIPAPETKERLREGEKRFNSIDLSMQSMKDKLDVLGEKMDKNDTQHQEILGKIDKFIEASDDKYASKETEKVLKKINWLIISSVIIVVLAIVLAAGYIATTHKY